MAASSFYLDTAMTALRYGVGLPLFFLKPMSLEDCYALVRRRVEEREANFLTQLKKSVYGNPQSPYYKLLRHARCEYGDVEKMLRRDGVNKTLETLNDTGVYITIEEFKGKRTVKRNGLSFQARPEDFDNPLVVQAQAAASSGTRQAPVSNSRSFHFFAERAAECAVQFDALEKFGAPYVLWSTLSRHLIYCAKIRRPPVQWFLPLSSNRNKVGFYYATIIGTLMGLQMPWPRRAGPGEALKVAEWLAENKSGRPSCVIHSNSSLAVRVASAARANGLDISGTHFIVGSEPLTPARAREISAAGCSVTAAYSSSEMGGRVGVGCVNSTGDDVHVFNSHIAMIQRSREVASTNATVNAFRATSLLPSAPKIMINMETGDYGTLETRRCGCKLDDLGFTDHLSAIRSFEKLTGEGMTFFAADLANIVEQLPVKFGGEPLDFQAIEEEDGQGLAHVTLLVSPNVGKIDDTAVIHTVLDELGKTGRASRMMARTWQEAGTLRVRREEPRATKAGKVFSFQVEARHG